VMIGTGLRISDLVSLDVVDLRGGDLIARTTKNRHGRLVPLDPALAPLLETYLVDCRREASTLDGLPLFVNRVRYRVTAGGTRQALDHARRSAGIDIPVSPHVLRHWFARDLAAHGTTDRLLAARMGWTSSTLQSRYAPVSESELRADVARYAPVVRLHAAGLLDRLLPIGRRPDPASAVARSNKVTGATWSGRSGFPRHS
jgi:integrase/recombinase XerD